MEVSDNIAFGFDGRQLSENFLDVWFNTRVISDNTAWLNLEKVSHAKPSKCFQYLMFIVLKS